MKKKSILLTAVLIVIAILAGCSDQVAWPDMPQKVNDAQVIPREGAADILEGQAFDASKFSVMVIYDNGKSEVLNTLTVYEDDGDHKAQNGEKLWAIAGLNVDNENVYAEGALVAYRINYITAEVKGTTYANAAGIPASDVVVTAHYFDSKNAEKTMVLSSNEYELVVEDVSAEIAENGSTVSTVTVNALVGYTDEEKAPTTSFDVTLTGEAESEELPEGAVVTGITVTYNGRLPKLNYGDAEDLPAIDMSKVKVEATVEDDAKTYKVVPASVEWVDGNGLPLLDGNMLATGAAVKVKAVYEDFEAVTSTAVALSNVTVNIKPAKNFAAEKLIAGTALPEYTTDDIIVETKYYNGEKEVFDRLTASDEGLAFKFGFAYGPDMPTEVSALTAITDGKVPAAGPYVAVYAEYLGQPSADLYVIGTAQPAHVAKVTDLTAKLTETPVLYKQHYDVDVREALTTALLSDISVKVDGEVVPLTAAEVEIAYSTAQGSFTELTDGKNLSATSYLYVFVLYDYGEEDPLTECIATITLQSAPAITGIELVPTYTYKLEGTDRPMLDSEITWTVRTYNEIGTVSENAGTYTAWVDGNGDSQKLPAEVAAAETKVSVVIGDVESDIITVPAGVPYVDVSSITAAKADTYIALIDDPISGNEDDYAIAGYTTKTGAEDPEIIDVKKSSQQQEVKATDNTLKVVVSYLDKTGKQLTKEVDVTAFEGKAWTDADSIELIYDAESGFDEIADGKMYYLKTYDLSKFKLDEDLIDKHEDTVSIKGYVSGEYDPETSKLITSLTGNLVPNNATSYSFVVGYTGTDGKAAEKVFNFALESQP